MIHQGETRPVSPPVSPPAVEDHELAGASVRTAWSQPDLGGVDGSRPLELSQRQNRTSGIDSTIDPEGIDGVGDHAPSTVGAVDQGIER